MAPNDITVSFEQSIFASLFLNKLCKGFTTIRGFVESEKCCSLHCRKAGNIQNTGNIIHIPRKDFVGILRLHVLKDCIEPNSPRQLQTSVLFGLVFLS